jgi:phage terminase large subunit-like protein
VGVVSCSLEGGTLRNAIKRQRLSTEQDNHSTTVNMSGLPKVNPHLGSLDKDFLYHIGYDNHQCKETFKDVKVCDQGMIVA